MLLTRFLLLHFFLFLGIFSLCFLSICHDFKKGPVSHFRSRIIFNVWWLVASATILVAGVSMEFEDIDVDYSYYLGPDYKDK